MKASLHIVPNVVALRCSGPCFRGLDHALREVVSIHESHNLIVTEGLTAWAYNAVNTDGEVIDRLLLGDSASAVSLAETAINLGAYGFVLKPFQASQLIIAISNALHRRRLEIENREHRELLEQMVAERTRELRQALAQLQLADEALRKAHD